MGQDSDEARPIPLAQEDQPAQRPDSAPDELNEAPRAESYKTSAMKALGFTSADDRPANNSVFSSIEFGENRPVQVAQFTGFAEETKSRLDTIVRLLATTRSSAANASPAASTTTNAPSAALSAWPQSAFESTGGNPGKLAFLIAMAAQANGLITQVIDMASRLERRFQARLASPDDKDAAPATRTLHFDLSNPRSAQIETNRGEIYVSLGPNAGERVRFKDPSDAQRILQHAWREFGPQLGPDIRQWLIDLADNRDFEIRVAAGVAAGGLTPKDFENIDRSFFDPWLRSRSTRPLDALDAGLTVAARENALRSTIIGRVKSWLEDADDIDQVLAAGFMSRGFYGWENPDCAFEIMGELLRHGRDLSFGEAARSFTSWYVWGEQEPARAQRAVIELDRVQPPARAQNRSGPLRGDERIDRSVFELQIAEIFLAWLEAAANEESDEYKLLASALRDPAASAAMGRLFNRFFSVRDGVLYRSGVARDLRTTARDLFFRALKEPKAAPAILSLFRAAAHHASTSEKQSLLDVSGGWRETAVKRGFSTAAFDDALKAPK